jgi:signal transduction histidine kinase
MAIFRCSIFLFIFIVVHQTSFAGQQIKIDSLLKIAHSTKQDSIRLNSYLEISGILISSSPDSAFSFAKKAMKIAKKINHIKGQIQAENMFGNCYQRKAEYDKSLKSYRKCMALAEKINDLKGLAQATNNIGIVYGNLGEYDKALEIYQKSMEYERKRKNRTGEAEALNNLGVIHYYLGNMEKTIYYLSEAIIIEEELGDNHLLKKGYINLGALMEYTKDYKGALKNYEKALIISEKLNDKHEISVCMNNIGGVYLNIGELDKSEKYYQEALKLKTELKDLNGQALSYINLGTIQERKNNKEKAIEYYNKALVISEKVKSKPFSKEAYKSLANVYESQGNYKQALFFQRKMEILKDSILNEEKTKVVAELETKYQSAEKERMLLIEKNRSAELEKENAIKEKNVALEKKKTAEAEEARAKSRNIAIGLAGGVIAIIFLALYILQKNRRKSQAEKDAIIISEREKGLQSIIETTETERRRIAKDLHDGIGQQLGGLKLAWQQIGKNVSPEEKIKLETLTKILDETSIEVRNLSHQMMPKMLEQDGLNPALNDMLSKTLGIAEINYEYNYTANNNRLSPQKELAIYRISQELIGNILKHSGANEVSIDFYERNNKYFLMIEDNGKGFKENEITSTGLGLQNIKARASAIQGEISFDSGSNKGTIVILSIPK